MANHDDEAPPAPEADTPEAVVAANVRRLREALGITQAELARRAALGSTDMALWGIETSKRRIRVNELCALAAALGTTPDRLLTPGIEPGSAARRYEVRIDGGITELVDADDAEADERGLLHFYLRGERVFFTSVARVLSVREAS